METAKPTPSSLGLNNEDLRDYREDLETLDLDSSLEESITLVEWGEGMVEGISDNRLEIKVERPQGGLAGADASGITDLGGVDDGARTITLTGYGPRWEKALNQL